MATEVSKCIQVMIAPWSEGSVMLGVLVQCDLLGLQLWSCCDVLTSWWTGLRGQAGDTAAGDHDVCSNFVPAPTLSSCHRVEIQNIRPAPVSPFEIPLDAYAPSRLRGGHARGSPRRMLCTTASHTPSPRRHRSEFALSIAIHDTPAALSRDRSS